MPELTIPHRAAPERPPPVRPYSLAHLTVIELDPPAVVACAAEAGFDLADLRLVPVVPEDRAYPILGDTPMRRELIARIADTGIGIFDVELIRLVRDLDVPGLGPLFETAARIGARRAKLVSLEEDEALSADLVGRVADLAAQHGLAVDLEFMVFTGVRTLAAAERVLRRSGAANAGLLVDSLHLARSGGSPAEVAALDPALLAYLHLCDAPADPPDGLAAVTEEARVGRMVPGTGGLPLAALLAALPPALPVSIELPMKALAARMPALERARRALAGARRVAALAALLADHPDLSHEDLTR